jgi:tetratricopeptide (TPR) repeat protein
MLILASLIGCSARSRTNTNLKNIENVSKHLNMGRNYFNQKRFTMAEREFLLILKKTPTNADALVGLGLIHLAQKQLLKSEQYFQRALASDPNYLDIYNYLGIIYSEQNKYIPAKKMLLRLANNKEYKYPEMAYLNLCKLEIKNEHYQTALRYARSGLSSNKKYIPLFFIQGFVYFKLEEYEKAIEYLKKADSMSQRPDLECLITLARAYYQIGDFDNSLKTLDVAFGVADNPEAIKTVTDLQKKINKQI